MSGRDIHALLRFLEEMSTAPFGWGSEANDCVTFAAGAVAVQTGCDPLGDLAWSSAADARRLLKVEGGMRRALDRRFSRVPSSLAQRGDIAGVACPHFGTRLMIVEGVTLAGPGERGLKRLPRAAMLVAWDVRSPRQDG